MLINCYWVINGGWESIGNGWVRLLSDRVPHSLCVLLIFICIWLYLTCWNLFGLFDSFYSGQWRLGFFNDSGAFFFFLVNQWHECVSKSTDVGHFIQVKSPDSIESILFDILTILIGFLIDSSEMIVEIGSLSSVLSLSLSFSFLFWGLIGLDRRHLCWILLPHSGRNPVELILGFFFPFSSYFFSFFQLPPEWWMISV